MMIDRGWGIYLEPHLRKYARMYSSYQLSPCLVAGHSPASFRSLAASCMQQIPCIRDGASRKGSCQGITLFHDNSSTTLKCCRGGSSFELHKSNKASLPGIAS